MCRLFGLYANHAVDVMFSFYKAKKSLKKLSEGNPDGWGVAWFDGVKWNLHKEPGPLHASRNAEESVKRVLGVIVVSHVRRATCGALKPENTHPWLYKGYVFAHNGVLDRGAALNLLSPGYRDLEGDTGSEVLFHLVVQEVEREGGFVEGVRRVIEKIDRGNVYYRSLNFIASDGRKLYALRCARERLSYYTLYYLERPSEGLRLEGLSKETAQLIRAKLAKGEKAALVASEPLTEEPWEKIPNKHLLVVGEDLETELIGVG